MRPAPDDFPAAPRGFSAAGAGFTLIETLVALTVILFGFMAVLVMHTGAMKSGTTAELQTMAVFLAEAKIEEFRNVTPDSLKDGVTEFDYLTRKGVEIKNPDGEEGKKPAEAFFTRSFTVKRQVPTQFTNELTVTL